MLYITFFIICFFGFLVVYSKNPVQSVLSLILVYLYTILVFLKLGAEYLALLILIVYVGALSIFFLFIVMMLNLRVVEVYNRFYNYLTLGNFLVLVLFFFITYSFYFSFGFLNSCDLYSYQKLSIFNYSNLVLLGQLLYNYYIDYFCIIIMILFVSFLGAIGIACNFELKKKYKVIVVNKLDVNF